LIKVHIYIYTNTGGRYCDDLVMMCMYYFILFIYLFAHKSTKIIAIKYMKQGRTARLTRALTAALKTTNSNINAGSELKVELKS